MQENSISTQLSDNTSRDESLCLQMKLQAEQANTKYPTPQHLFTNLEFKVKPHKNKTKFLWARIDTCTDVNIMPVIIYKYLFKDPDCAKIAPTNLQLGTYTNRKVMILGYCNLYVIHPDTRCTAKVLFFVASNEGSILISCTTSLALGLIKPHDRLDHLSTKGNVISSSADKLKDESQLKVHLLVRKPKLKSNNEKAPVVCSSDGQSKSNKEQFVNICSNEQSSATCKEMLETRTFKLIKVHICGQLSQTWAQFIYGQIDQQCQYRIRCQCNK